MIDQRLLQLDDVFFFELEEMKRMMTGEWNVSDQQEIQATCARRKAAVGQWQQVAPSTLLIGDVEATPHHATVASGLGYLWSIVGV